MKYLVGEMKYFLKDCTNRVKVTEEQVSEGTKIKYRKPLDNNRR